jgi:hypothetical protein
MASRLKLHTAEETFRALHVQCDTHKRGGKLRVDRDALMNLLMDHSALIAQIGPDKVESPSVPTTKDELMS